MCTTVVDKSKFLNFKPDFFLKLYHLYNYFALTSFSDKAVLSSRSGTFTLPSSDMLLTNESIHGQFIDVNVCNRSL